MDIFQFQCIADWVNHVRCTYIACNRRCLYRSDFPANIYSLDFRSINYYQYMLVVLRFENEFDFHTAHWEQVFPVTPDLQKHWPVFTLHDWLKALNSWQPQAKNNKGKSWKTFYFKPVRFRCGRQMSFYNATMNSSCTKKNSWNNVLLKKPLNTFNISNSCVHDIGKPAVPYIGNSLWVHLRRKKVCIVHNDVRTCWIGIPNKCRLFHTVHYFRCIHMDRIPDLESSLDNCTSQFQDYKFYQFLCNRILKRK